MDLTDASLPALATILTRGAAMLLLILGGILAIRYGYKLYLHGVGAHRDEASFKLRSVTIGARSVGSVVMATAVLWGWAGVTVSPKFEAGNGVTKVYSFLPEKGGPSITAQSLSVPLTADKALAVTDAEGLKKLFRRAYDASGSGYAFTIEGAPAQPTDVQVTTTDGVVTLTGRIQAGGGASAVVTFRPEILDKQVAFTPIGAEG